MVNATFVTNLLWDSFQLLLSHIAHAPGDVIPSFTLLALVHEAVSVKLGDFGSRDTRQPVKAVCVLTNDVLEYSHFNQLFDCLMRVSRTKRPHWCTSGANF